MKVPFRIDERSLGIWHRIQSILHSFTVLALVVMFFYRHNISGQTFEEIWDIGGLMMLNGLFLFTAVLYFGGVSFKRIKIKWVAAAYVVFLVVMFLFISLVETVLKGAPFDFYSIAGRMPVVAVVCGVIVLVFVLFAFMGKRKAARDLE